MLRTHRGVAVIVMVAGLQVLGCSQTPSTPGQKGAAVKVERVPGATISRLTLSQSAVERLGIKTEPVAEQLAARSGATAAPRKVVPYGAVLYDPSGQAWVYVNQQELTYVRHAIKVDYIERERAVLSDGPPLGTKVVMIGAAELFGTEYGR